MIRWLLPLLQLRPVFLLFLSLNTAGATFSLAAENWVVRSSAFAGRVVQDIATGDGLVLAVTYEPGEGSRLLLSTDGLDFEEVYTLDAQWLNGVAYGGGRFVVVGDDGRVLTSTDGQAWVAHNTWTGHSLRAVAYGDGLYVAIGAPGRFLASADGKGWSEVGPLFGSTYRDIAFGGGRFVAVSGSGNAALSLDGLSWAEAAMPAPTFLRSIAYGDGKFVAVGKKRDTAIGGDIWVSSDGDIWTRHAVEEARGFLSVAFGNGVFVVGGRNGEMFTSSDAQEWGRAATWIETWFHGLTPHEDAFLATGAPGLFLGSIPVHTLFADWREQGHFTAEELADLSISGPEADPGDFGIPNITRYALGLDPVVPDWRQMPKMMTEGGVPFFTFGWLSDATDLMLSVEHSSNLNGWSTTDESAIQRIDYGRFEKVELPISPEEARTFFRLEIGTTE